MNASIARREGLAVGGLSFAYDSRQVFDDFSLISSAGRIVIKGPSGCGKTTLLRILFGSLPSNPGSRLPKFHSSLLVLQEDSLFPWLTGRANISRFVRAASAEAINGHALFNTVEEFIDRPGYKLSYGQRRCIELFRAILFKPSVLYLDEPFNFLDDKRADVFIQRLIELSDHSVQLVMTTHRHDHSLDAVSDVFAFAGDPPYSALERIR